MRSNKRAFSSQVASLGGSENAIKQTSILKPSGFTWLAQALAVHDAR